MFMNTTFPARLHILLAQEHELGVVIRRGPSKQVCTLLWDRSCDEFRVGQWLKGRIYERRCDLSPDGKYLIYFAMNGHWQTGTGGAWTAISYAPYLKALALFAKGDCWHGGGLFTGRDTYWLNNGYGHTTLWDTAKLRRDLTYLPTGSYGGECLSVYYPRLLRDGWQLTEATELGELHHLHLFEKPCGEGWVLRKLAHASLAHPPGKGCYWDEHVLFHPGSATSIPCGDWEWAEVDRTRLVWASRGQLFTSSIRQGVLLVPQMLYDFNPLRFEPLVAPY